VSVLTQEDSVFSKRRAEDNGVIVVPKMVLQNGGLSVRAVGHNALGAAPIVVPSGVTQFTVTLPILIVDGRCAAVVWQRTPWWHFW
jgi:hypothetical protein